MSEKSCETCADKNTVACAECDDCHQWRPTIIQREDGKGLKIAGDYIYFVCEETGIKNFPNLSAFWFEGKYQQAVKRAEEMARSTQRAYIVLAIRARVVPLSEHVITVDEIPLWLDH